VEGKVVDAVVVKVSFEVARVDKVIRMATPHIEEDDNNETATSIYASHSCVLDFMGLCGRGSTSTQARTRGR